MEKNFVSLGVELSFRTPRLPKLYNLFWGEGFRFIGSDKTFFKRCVVHAKLTEKAICPFCNKEMDGLQCDCEAFRKSFESLQNQIMTEKNNCYDGSITIIKSNLLSLTTPDYTGEILVQPHDGRVDDIFEIDQVLEGKIRNKTNTETFSVDILNTTYDGEIVTFLVLFNDEKVMYNATMKLPYKPLPISIGRWGDLLLSQENTRDTIEPDLTWYEYKKFDSWKQFCDYLLAISNG